MARIARRTLLTTAAAWPLATLPLRLTRAGEAQRVLVLVELNGGNDGLNTVVPYADPGYRRARPSLAVARDQIIRSEEHTSELQSLMRISYAVFCLKKKNKKTNK